jgi:UDP-N-acetyl-D-glucosamine dehydrogenase
MDHKKILLGKIKTKKAVIGIIGMGYVGRPLAELSSSAGFHTIGFVRSQKKADSINQLKIRNLTATVDKNELKKADVILVCVQTPVFKNKKPDLRDLKNATFEIVEHLRRGQLIVTESSIAPGTTRNVILPILNKSSLIEGKDYFLAFSPERVDPGNKKFALKQIPKVVSGISDDACDLAVAFYRKIIDLVVPVSSVETAELVKIFENTYRLINISLVNQVHEYASKINVDMWEVVNAARTKPFGFQAHYPGPGIGGHCIPVDPYYLLDDAQKKGIDLSLIEEAGKVNEERPKKVAQRALEIVTLSNGFHENHVKSNGHFLYGTKGGRSLSNKKFKALLLGVAYKPDIDDPRESPALKIWEMFERLGFEVSYHDPYIPEFNNSKSVKLSKENINKQDILVITTNHSSIDYLELAQYKKPILDTRNTYSTRPPLVFGL